MIDLAQEITSRIPIVKQERDKLIEIFRKFGWLVPSRLLRSLIIKREFHKQPCGFSMTSLPTNVDALTYYTIPPFSSANFAIGRIVETAKADIKQNQLTAQVTLAVDHRIFDGNRAAILLNGLKDFLENIENHNQSQNLL